MSSVFTVVDPGDLSEAHRRTMPTSVRLMLQDFHECAPRCNCESLARYPLALARPDFPDTAQLQALLYSARQYAVVAKAGGDFHWPQALYHLRLDSPQPGRIADLIRFQALGLDIAAALDLGTSLEVCTDLTPAPLVWMPRFGGVYFGSDASGVHVTVRDGTATITNSGARAQIRRTGEWMAEPPLRFIPTLNVSLGDQLSAEMPVDDPCLAQPAFQNLPLLLGHRAAGLFASEVTCAAEWLLDLRIPNLRGMLAWCKACLGLVSVGDTFGSASRMQALGLIYLPVGRPTYELAECLLHETMHQHLFRLDHLAPLLDAGCDCSEQYYSPWRDDPRPLLMTLHGAYVFTAVAAMYQRVIETESPDVPEQFALSSAYKRVSQALHALEVVERHAVLANAGQRVFTQTRSHGQEIFDWVRPRLDGRTREEVDLALAQHRKRWQVYRG